MDHVRATRNYGFRCPVFGEGRLEKGKVYYSYSKFAQDVTSDSAGKIVNVTAPPIFTNETVEADLENARVLVIHSGGYGDTVTLGILLKQLQEERGSMFDVCCHYDKFTQILSPFGFKCNWVSYPPVADELSNYDYVLPELCKLVKNPTALVNRPLISLLAEGLGLSDHFQNVQYSVPGSAKRDMRLPNTNRIRIGINFDSNSPLRSYPKALQPAVVKLLLVLGCELFFLGRESISEAIDCGSEVVRDYTGKTSILQLAALLDQMDFVLAVDSLAANLSGILGKRTLTLMSTTGEGVFGHFRSVSGIGSAMKCSPCGSVQSHSRCPLSFPNCKAFYHPSVGPDIIVKTVVKNLSEHFGGMA